jgi:hypothetical protein
VKKYCTPPKQGAVEDGGFAVPDGQFAPNVPPYSKLGSIVPRLPP